MINLTNRPKYILPWTLSSHNVPASIDFATHSQLIEAFCTGFCSIFQAMDLLRSRKCGKKTLEM